MPLKGLRNIPLSGVASAGSPHYLWHKLAAGTRLRMARARDYTKGSQRVTMMLCDGSILNTGSGPCVAADLTENYLVLNGDTWQKGQGDWVQWDGDVIIGDDLCYFVASFATPDADDVLYAWLGVE